MVTAVFHTCWDYLCRMKTSVELYNPSGYPLFYLGSTVALLPHIKFLYALELAKWNSLADQEILRAYFLSFIPFILFDYTP